MTYRDMAFLDFVCDNNPHGIDLADSVEMAEQALAILYEKKKVSMKTLVDLTDQELWAKRLLQKLVDMFRNTPRWMEFVEALFDFHLSNSDVHDREQLAEIFNGEKIVKYLLEKRRHKFVEVVRNGRWFIDGDSIWKMKVRRFISHGDFRRAYDELKSAGKGFFVGANWKDPKPSDYVMAASRPTLSVLIHELFEAMIVKGLLGDLLEADCFLRDYRYTENIFQEHKGKAPRHYTTSAYVAGYELAKIFLATLGNPYLHPPQPYVFGKEGGMVLKMGAYFRKKDNEAKRKKHEEAKRLYDAKHP